MQMPPLTPRVSALLALSALALFGQIPDAHLGVQPPAGEAPKGLLEQPVGASSPIASARSSYVLGAGDQITVRVLEADEIASEPIHIATDGHIDLPMVGTLEAAGLTVEQLEARLTEALTKYILEPDVAVSIVEFGSQPVSVIGAVNQPGVHQLRGEKTLVEILSLAGGLRDDAGHSVKITRRIEWGDIPLPTAQADPSGRFSVADVSLERVIDAKDPLENVLIYPHDVISVPRAQMVYVVGAVERSGGFVLRERESLSVLEALALAGGLGRAAAPHKAKILRPVETDGAGRDEIAINLRKIMAGESEDVLLRRDDLLFVPRSGGKVAAARAADAAIQIGTGLLIWRR